MVQIIVSVDQAKQIEASTDAIEIVDVNGTRLGFFAKPFSDAEIDEAKRRSQFELAGSPTDEVLARLARLGME